MLEWLARISAFDTFKLAVQAKVNFESVPIMEENRRRILEIVINDCPGLEFSETKECDFTGRSGENDSDTQIIRCSGSVICLGLLTFPIFQEALSSQFYRCNQID
jgi:hypothetical protein